MSNVASAGGVDSAGAYMYVFTTFKYYIHMLHKVKDWRNPYPSTNRGQALLKFSNLMGTGYHSALSYVWFC